MKYKDIKEMQEEIHQQNILAGWWDDVFYIEELIDKKSIDKSIGENILANYIGNKISLMHSELSEALEGFRKDLMDDKLPHRKMIEVEFADSIIRILDTAEYLKLDVSGAISEKLNYNKTREDHKKENRIKRNGKKF